MNTLITIAGKYLFVLIGPVAAYVFLKADAAWRKTLLLRGIMVLVTGIVLAKGAGALYFEPRPFVTMHRQPLFPHEADNGFPSDHTLLVFSCAFLLYPINKRAAGAAMLIGAFVGAARVAALVHSPLDIAASIGIALLTGLAAAKIIKLPHNVAPEG
jgi:undecaprenyl-diphosphatase